MRKVYMTPTSPNTSQTLLTLRQEFDFSFAQPPRAATEIPENMLAIRLGGDAYAIRIAEVGGLYADRRIMPLPTPLPELLGVAGFRGQIAPVYDLAALLGYTRQTPPRWMILVRLREPVALAFDQFEAHFAVLPERIVSTSAAMPADATRPHLRDAVRSEDTVRPIIHLQSLLDDIQRRVDSSVQPRSAEA